MSEQIKIVIADDHVVVRRGLRLLLDAEEGFEVRVVAVVEDDEAGVDRLLAGRIVDRDRVRVPADGGVRVKPMSELLDMLRRYAENLV